VNPSVALLLSIFVVLLLLRLKVHSGGSLFCGSVLLALLVLPPAETPRLLFRAAIDVQTLRLLGIVICALTISHLMETRGMLTRLANALEGIGPKLALHVVPIAIGLMPLPAGAVVSATASKDLVRRLHLSPPQATFINFWFRHLCEFATPVYPSIIMTGVILSVPLSFVLLHLAPIWMLMLLFGGIVSWRILRRAPTQDEGSTERSAEGLPRQLLRSAWPVALVFALVLAGLDAAPAFFLALLALVLQQRMSRLEVKEGLKRGLSPKILFLLYSVMLYKNVVDVSGAADALFTGMQTAGLSHAVILVALPLLIGFSSGLSSAMVGISIPLLAPFLTSGNTVDGAALLLAYGAGGVGHMLSPLHLCLVLSAEYFHARLASVYRLLLPPAIAILISLVALYVLLESM
jgi:integral membrane protein (TIGR00529 family)